MKKRTQHGPKLGAFRIAKYSTGDIYIQEAKPGWAHSIGRNVNAYTYWSNIASARTLWGIRRQWKKLFGASKPFPSFTVWTSEEVA